MKPEYDLIISGENIVNPPDDYHGPGTVLIADGVIKGFEKRMLDPEELPASEKIVLKHEICGPGLIDMHTHLREPGREDEETIESGAHAAAAGGFTSVCAMPNTTPPLDNQESVMFVIQKAKEAEVRVYPIGAVTRGQNGEHLADIGEMVAAGAVAVSDDGLPVMNAQIMRLALEYARMFGVPVIPHCEDTNLSADGVANEGFYSTLLGLKGIPSAAEEVMVARDIALARFTSGRLHIAHVSTAGSVQLIRRAKAGGLPITCEATPHHFSLTDELLKTFDTNLRVNPPIRSEEDVSAIKEGLADGTIDCIATDHAPHASEEKEVEFDSAPCGIIGLETMVGLAATELIQPGILSWTEFFRKSSTNPARILNLPAGSLKAGSPADLTIIDPDLEWKADVSEFKSKSKNSPFIGWKLRGRPVRTIVGGKTVFSLDR